MENRRTMLETGSTWSIGIGSRARRVHAAQPHQAAQRHQLGAWSSTSEVYSLKTSYRRVRVAC